MEQGLVAHHAVTSCQWSWLNHTVVIAVVLLAIVAVIVQALVAVVLLSVVAVVRPVETQFAMFLDLFAIAIFC